MYNEIKLSFKEEVFFINKCVFIFSLDYTRFSHRLDKLLYSTTMFRIRPFKFKQKIQKIPVFKISQNRSDNLTFFIQFINPLLSIKTNFIPMAIKTD